MKKAGILLVLLTACLGLPAREVINLNRDWRFFSYSEGSSDRAQNVNLPHTWNNDALGGKNDYFRGVGNYMKDIQVPLEWRNKRVFIRFSGAGTVTDLIVNGRHVGTSRRVRGFHVRADRLPALRRTEPAVGDRQQRASA